MIRNIKLGFEVVFLMRKLSLYFFKATSFFFFFFFFFFFTKLASFMT
jgi:hypothetical protein